MFVTKSFDDQTARNVIEIARKEMRAIDGVIGERRDYMMSQRRRHREVGTGLTNVLGRNHRIGGGFGERKRHFHEEFNI